MIVLHCIKFTTMPENLFNLIKEQGTDSDINNPVILIKQNNAMIADAI